MKTQEEIDLEAAQALVASARQKVAAADQLKVEATAKAVADYKARLEKEEFEKRAWREQIEAQFAAKKKAEEDAAMAERTAQIAAQRELENAFNKAEEAKQKRIADEKEIARVTAQAFALEQEARQAEQEVIRQAVRQREQEAKHDTEFNSDDDGTLPVEQVNGLDHSEGGLEAPGQMNSHLRRLFGRSEATAKETPAFVPNFEQAPQPLTNAEIQVTLEKMYGKEVVVAAIAYLGTQKGTNNIQTYLSANHRRVDQ